jgi:hypothetical protein
LSVDTRNLSQADEHAGCAFRRPLTAPFDELRAYSAQRLLEQ